MKTNVSRLVVLASITAFAVLVLFACLNALIEQPTPVTQLEATVASLPLGVTAEEADKHMGSSPDSITQRLGVLASPVTMLAAENDLAAEYGPPENFTLRRWSRNGVNAIVAIDENGNVAGRWSYRAEGLK